MTISFYRFWAGFGLVLTTFGPLVSRKKLSDIMSETLDWFSVRNTRTLAVLRSGGAREEL